MSATSKWNSRYGPWAVVTGASDGIGREFARRLAERGLNVVLVARRSGRLKEVAGELRNRHNVEALTVSADLGMREGVEQVWSATEALDVGLFVAAAGFGTSGPFIGGELPEEIEMLRVNCEASMAMSWMFGRRMAKRGRGGIVLMSSIVAFQGVPRAAHYAATKAYVQTLAEALNKEMKPLGVDVLACAPGPIRSGFGARADMRMGMAEPVEAVAAVTLNALGRKTTVRPGRLAKVLGYSLAMLPRWGRTQVLAGVMGGMTRHQDEAAEAKARGSA